MDSNEKGLDANANLKQEKGGYRAAMYIFVMTGLENVGFVANLSSLVLYFMLVMHFDLAGASTTLTNFVGTTFIITIMGGFISDIYMTRLNTVLMFGFFQIVGYILLTVQAYFKHLHPCELCVLEGSNKILFYSSLAFLAVGYGGVRGALPSLGADQFNKSNMKERKQLGSFFNWLLMSITLGASFGVTVIVWIASVKSTWAVGFFISTLIAIAGFGILAVGKPYYRVRVAGDSPLNRIFQVTFLAIKNRNLSLPDSSEGLYEINEKGAVEEKILHSPQFRFLDKAAVLAEGTNPEPANVCTVTQVEEVKILIRMLPVLASTIIMNTCLAQLQTVSVEQGNYMYRLLNKFEVPAASVPVIPLIFMTILVPIYEFGFVPLARCITGHPRGITHLQRVAVGLVLSVLSMVIAGVVEVKRKNAFNLHFEQISIFWLSFQYGIFGIADLFTFIGLLEFFYSEAPAGMRSLASSFTFLSLSLGYFMSSAFVQIVENISAKTSSDGLGWLTGLNPNLNHLEKFYWLLAAISSVNFVVYVLCAHWYKYRKSLVGDDGDASEGAEINRTDVVTNEEAESEKEAKSEKAAEIEKAGEDVKSTAQ